MEYLSSLPGCVLEYHYKAFQWLNLVCGAPTEVSPEVSVTEPPRGGVHRLGST
jgi:hypothetical protein